MIKLPFAALIATAAVAFLVIVFAILSYTGVVQVSLPHFDLFGNSHVIVLKADGFHPAKLTIKEGETVTFTTTTGKPFWPASNVHPTHTAFPAFDPKQPIPPDQSWSFTFDKMGRYGFHDHIESTFEGEILVTRADGSFTEVDCSKQKNVQCWEQLITQTVRDQGVEAGLNKILYLSETEPEFKNDCHGYVHIIGKEAYQLYAQNKDFTLTPATSLCGYGFYHGFMEVLLLTTGDIEQARAFCKYADEQLSGLNGAASTACYHGVGHGAVDGSDPSAWGDIDAIMAPGFKLCDTIAQNDFQLYLCETGVFNATEILSQDPKYGISDLRTDPYAMCNKQPQHRREGCYSNMVPIVLEMAQNDFDKAAKYINDNMIDKEITAIDGHTLNQMVTLGLMFEYIRVYGQTPGYQEKGIDFCRRQPADDHLACIEGLSGGLMKYGKPGVEYVENLAFCANTMLTSEERDSCYQYTLPRMNSRYDIPTTQKICDQVPEEYRNKYCSYAYHQ